MLDVAKRPKRNALQSCTTLSTAAAAAAAGAHKKNYLFMAVLLNPESPLLSWERLTLCFHQPSIFFLCRNKQQLLRITQRLGANVLVISTTL